MLGIVVTSSREGVAAPATNVTAELSAKIGTLGDTFTWAIIAHETSDVTPPIVEAGADFEVRYRGPQSSVQIQNGAVRRELRFVYHLIPRREGKLITPRATVTVMGKTYDVAPLEVEIAKSAPGAPQQIDGVSVFQSVDKTTVYLGQQLTNTIEIRTARQLIEPQFGDLTFDGFRHLDLGDDQRSTRIVQGRPMTVITLKKALYPIRAGELAISARELRAKMRVSESRRGGFPFDFSDPFGSGIFDDFFGGGALREVRVSSEPLAVTVKALPPKPPGLSHWPSLDTLVGHTGINLTMSTDPLQFGETRPMTIELTSEGNIAPVTSIPFPPSPAYKIYQDPPETKVYDSEGTVVTRKNFKASLVPVAGGRIEIPPLALSYFDPTTGQYKTTRSNGFVVDVMGGPPPTPVVRKHAPPTLAEPDGGTVTERYEELGALERLSRQVSLPLALLVSTVVAVVLLIARARGLRRKEIAQSERLWRSVELASSATELRSAFLAALAHELGLPPTESAHAIGAEIRKRHLSSDLDFAFSHMCDNLERALYGGGNAPPSLDSLRTAAQALRAAIPRRSS